VIKIISRLVSLVYVLFADHDITDLLQREHPKILAGIGVENGRGEWSRRTRAIIFLKHSQTGPRLPLRTNWKSHTCFQFVPKMNVLDLEGSLGTLFQNTCTMLLVIFYRSFTFNLFLGNKFTTASLSEPEANNNQSLDVGKTRCIARFPRDHMALALYMSHIFSMNI